MRRRRWCFANRVIRGSSLLAAVELIFGTTDGSEKGLLAAGGQAGEALREIFPIPGLWYGPNYV